MVEHHRENSGAAQEINRNKATRLRLYSDHTDSHSVHLEEWAASVHRWSTTGILAEEPVG